MGNSITLDNFKELVYNDKEFGDRYLISTCGEIFDKKKNRYKKSYINSQGYLVTLLQGYTINIHRAVACTFIPNPLNMRVINHIDGNRLNNNVNNLEWCSQKYNIHHAWNNGLCDKRKIKVLCINKDGEETIYNSIKEASLSINVAESQICNYLKGNINTCKGYILRRL